MLSRELSAARTSTSLGVMRPEGLQGVTINIGVNVLWAPMYVGSHQGSPAPCGSSNAVCDDPSSHSRASMPVNE
jgi:hypothetical protein